MSVNVSDRPANADETFGQPLKTFCLTFDLEYCVVNSAIGGRGRGTRRKEGQGRRGTGRRGSERKCDKIRGREGEEENEEEE